MIKNKKFFNVKEVSALLRVSERTVFRYIHDGKLKAFKVGYWRIEEDDLGSFLNNHSSLAAQHGKKLKSSTSSKIPRKLHTGQNLAI